MGGVAGQEDTSDPKIRHLALIDPEGRKPCRFGEDKAVGAPPFDQRLDFRECGISRLRTGTVSNVGYDAIATRGDGEEGEYALRVPIDTKLVRR
jgi:hypothetical protein